MFMCSPQTYENVSAWKLISAPYVQQLLEDQKSNIRFPKIEQCSYNFPLSVLLFQLLVLYYDFVLNITHQLLVIRFDICELNCWTINFGLPIRRASISFANWGIPLQKFNPRVAHYFRYRNVLILNVIQFIFCETL